MLSGDQLSRASAESALYASLMAAASVLGLAKGLMFAAALSPEGFGYYSLSILASSYLTYLMGFGLKEGVLRNGSILFGKSQVAALDGMRDQAITSCGLGGLAVAPLLAACIWLAPLLSMDARLALLLSLALGFMLNQFNLLTNDLRIRQRLVAFSSCLVARNVLIVVLGAVVAPRFGFTGAVAVEASVNLALALAIAVVVRPRLLPVRLDREALGSLVRTGLPLSGSNFLRNLSLNVDRWFVAIFLGANALGQYGFALLGVTAGAALLNLITQAMGPKWLADYGRTDDLRELRDNVAATVRRIGAGAALVGLALIPVVPWVIGRFFAEYSATLVILPLIYIGVAFYVANLFDWVAVAANRGSSLVRIFGTVAATAAILCGVVGGLAWGLVAYATVFTFARTLEYSLTWRLSNSLVAAQHD